MRKIIKTSRRTWLVHTSRVLLASLAGLFVLPRSSRSAEIDYFTGTDFVGKNRAGKFKQFYINYWKPHRRIDASKWSLEVTGLCHRPGRYSLDELLEIQGHEQESRLKCVECWSARARWSGFSFAEIERRVEPMEESVGVVFHCADAYIEHLSLETLRQPRTLLVTHMNGAPLPDEHGFPLRVIAPMKYGYKNPKAILKMEFVSQEVWGTWSKIGPYSTDGTILPGTDHPLEYNKQPRRISGGEIIHY